MYIVKEKGKNITIGSVGWLVGWLVGCCLVTWM